jgi:hypothetical protein
MSSLILLLFLFSLYVTVVSSYTITVRPGAELCFIELVEQGQKIYGSYQVYNGGHLDVDVSIYDPQSKVAFATTKLTEDTFQMYAQYEGDYKLCFNNGMSSVSSKELSFHIYIGEEANLKSAAKAEHVSPLQQQVNLLVQSVNQAKDAQDYMKHRESRHSQTSISNNHRVFWWSMGKFLLLVAVSVAQIVFLLRLFEKKRGY